MSTAPRVLLAAQQLRRTVPGGIGTYARGVLQGLAQLDAAGEAVASVSVYASRAPTSPDPLSAMGRPVRASALPGPVLTRLWDLGVVRAPGGFDVVHSVSLAAPPTRREAAGVVAVHDLAWRRTPDQLPGRARSWHEAALSRALRRATAFVVPAPAVAAELVDAGADPAAVRQIPFGCDHLAAPDDGEADRVLARLGVAEGFLLSVSTLEPRKNLARLFTAYDRARSSLPAPWPLLVVGPEGWGPDLEPGPGVLLSGAVGEGALSALYRRARLLAYVPLEEGYGLPVVEAMSCGTPVVASPVPSTGGAAYEVVPTDVDAIADALVAVATDEALRARLADSGRAHSAELTWARSARAHVELWRALT
ncbi:MAG TPA: glycosyltransferase family 1 protein [Acidimicrobiales bacterium]|nr:glycosyltransferase family 1 protein [Acidimicrobiales bacterium]